MLVRKRTVYTATQILVAYAKYYIWAYGHSIYVYKVCICTWDILQYPYLHMHTWDGLQFVYAYAHLGWIAGRIRAEFE